MTRHRRYPWHRNEECQKLPMTRLRPHCVRVPQLVSKTTSIWVRPLWSAALSHILIGFSPGYHVTCAAMPSECLVMADCSARRIWQRYLNFISAQSDLQKVNDYELLTTICGTNVESSAQTAKYHHVGFCDTRFLAQDCRQWNTGAPSTARD